MANQHAPAGMVNITPEGGPVNEGPPPADPGAGQVRLTPEGGPLGDAADAVLQPPTWQEHMKGPIIGMDDRPAANQPQAHASTSTPPPPYSPPAETDAAREDETELKKWPPHTGKPVSDTQDAWKYAAPVVSQAEKLAIAAIGLAGTGLTKLAGYLEQRRTERTSSDESSQH